MIHPIHHFTSTTTTAMAIPASVMRATRSRRVMVAIREEAA